MPEIDELYAKPNTGIPPRGLTIARLYTNTRSVLETRLRHLTNAQGVRCWMNRVIFVVSRGTVIGVLNLFGEGI
jgi:hypothetical protein